MRLLRLPPLDNPMWQGVGAWVGVAGILISIATAIVFFWIGRPQKSMSYEVISNAPLFVTNADIMRKVEVLFEGRPVENPSLVLVRIWNSGNVDIPMEDFVQPTLIRYEGGGVLSAEVTQQDPSNLVPFGWSPQINPITNTISLPRLLMNSGESFTVQMVFSDNVLIQGIEGRISGIKEISLFTPPSSSDNNLLTIIEILVSLCFFVLYVTWIRKRLPKWLIGDDDLYSLAEELTLSVDGVTGFRAGVLVSAIFFLVIVLLLWLWWV